MIVDTYTATPADPDSTPFQKQYSVAVAVNIARNVSKIGLGAIRIAHNSLFAEANRLDDLDAATLAFEARERLWDEIMRRERF